MTRRKILTPAFHFKILDEFVGVFDKQGKILIENLKKHDGKIVDIFPIVALSTLDVICGEEELIKNVQIPCLQRKSFFLYYRNCDGHLA